MSIAHPDHFVNVARRAAEAEAGALFVDQFENPANTEAHEVRTNTVKRLMSESLCAFEAAQICC